MRYVLVCFLLLATLLPAAGTKSKSAKLPDVELTAFKAVRDQDRILIDGGATVHRKEPIPGLRIKIDLLAPGKNLISERRVTLTKELLEPGDDVPFSLACRSQAGAVNIRVHFYSARRNPLTLANPGPYPIE